MMVNIALYRATAAQCPQGVPVGASMTITLIVEAVSNALHGCPTSQMTATPVPTPTPTPTATIVPPTPTPTFTPIPPTPFRFCDLPGSVQTTANGLVVVPGGPANASDLSFLHLPVGFCAHFFAKVGNTRQLRFAPGGELFVASPTRATTGGGPGGQAAIIVLPDDDHDGVADRAMTFLDRLPAARLPSTQGLLFTGGYLYYQDGTKIMRVPYAAGDRTPSGSSEQVADITIYVVDRTGRRRSTSPTTGPSTSATAGTRIEPCDPAHPFHGGILKLDGSPGGTPVAKGFRNPISLRCSRGHNLCFAVELTRDYTATQGGREKLVPIRQGDDWGFPCCATKDLPFPDITPVPDCSTVASEIDSFIVGDTPFDLDFETGRVAGAVEQPGVCPAPWRVRDLGGSPRRRHRPRSDHRGGAARARIWTASSSGALAEFASGWDDGTLAHGRPAVVAFAPDGRLFLGNDNTGDIIWIAPASL